MGDPALSQRGHGAHTGDTEHHQDLHRTFGVEVEALELAHPVEQFLVHQVGGYVGVKLPAVRVEQRCPK
jgi:hypothetical protein